MEVSVWGGVSVRGGGECMGGVGRVVVMGA